MSVGARADGDGAGTRGLEPDVAVRVWQAGGSTTKTRTRLRPRPRRPRASKPAEGNIPRVDPRSSRLEAPRPSPVATGSPHTLGAGGGPSPTIPPRRRTACSTPRPSNNSRPSSSSPWRWPGRSSGTGRHYGPRLHARVRDDRPDRIADHGAGESRFHARRRAAPGTHQHPSRHERFDFAYVGAPHVPSQHGKSGWAFSTHLAAPTASPPTGARASSVESRGDP
jgi:hypothetical protein